jgi:hypothetical protein
MAKYVRKNAVVEARKHEGPTALSVHHKHKGQQLANPGDYLVHDPVAEGEEVQRGDIHVMTAEQFEAEYDPMEEAPAKKGKKAAE